jgi:hypothetical protein
MRLRKIGVVVDEEPLGGFRGGRVAARAGREHVRDERFQNVADGDEAENLPAVVSKQRRAQDALLGEFRERLADRTRGRQHEHVLQGRHLRPADVALGEELAERGGREQ